MAIGQLHGACNKVQVGTALGSLGYWVNYTGSHQSLYCGVARYNLGGDMNMGAFFDKAHEAVRRIPRGCVSTYGDVARAVGEPRKARFVGYAMRANPSPGQGEGDIPCHRVVFADGQICDGFAFGGPDVQRALLQSEGVPFVDSMHVDLDKCRWQFVADGQNRPSDIDWAAEMAEGADE